MLSPLKSRLPVSLSGAALPLAACVPIRPCCCEGSPRRHTHYSTKRRRWQAHHRQELPRCQATPSPVPYSAVRHSERRKSLPPDPLSRVVYAAGCQSRCKKNRRPAPVIPSRAPCARRRLRNRGISVRPREIPHSAALRSGWTGPRFLRGTPGAVRHSRCKKSAPQHPSSRVEQPASFAGCGIEGSRLGRQRS
jgi:hypothetical protein